MGRETAEKHIKDVKKAKAVLKAIKVKKLRNKRNLKKEILLETKVALKKNQDKAREESREGEKRKMKDLDNQKAQNKELAKQRKLKKPPTVLDKKIAAKASNDEVSAHVRQRKHEITEQNKKQAHQ